MPFDVAGARKAGYSDSEIADFLAPMKEFDTAAARKSGYDDSEIVDFLAKAPDPLKGGLINSMMRENDAREIESGVSTDMTDLPRDTGPVKSGLPNNDVLNSIKGEAPSDAPEKPSDHWALTRGLVTNLMGDNPRATAETLEGFSFLVPNNTDRVDSETGMGAVTESMRKMQDKAPHTDEMLRDASKQVLELANKSPKDFALRAEEPSLKNFDLGKTLTWVGEGVGGAIGSSAASIVGALVGGAVAGPVGAAFGAAAPSYVLNYGDVYGQLKAAGVPKEQAAKWAFGAAIPITALDTINPTRWVGGLGTKEAKAEAVRGVVKRILAETGESGVIEAGTEGAQDLISSAAVSAASDKPFFTAETAKSAALSAIIGGLTGGIMGGGAKGITEALTPAAEAPADNSKVDAYIQHRDNQLSGGLGDFAPGKEPVAAANPRGWETNPISEGTVLGGTESTEGGAPALDAAPPADTVTPQQKVSVDAVLAAPDVDSAIAAAAEAAVASPTGAPRASLDQMIDETKKSLDQDLPNLRSKRQAAVDQLYANNRDAIAEPLEAWEPDPAKPDAGAVTPEFANAAREHFAKYGVDVVFVKDIGEKGFDGVVDERQPNTVFISSNPTRAVAQISMHELGHTFEGVKLPDGSNLNQMLKQQLAEGLTSDARLALELHSETAPSRASFPSTPEGQAAHADAVLDHLYNELGKDMIGDAPRFTGFVEKVIGAVEERYGKNVATDVLGKLMTSLRESFNTLQKFFKPARMFETDKWVTNLDQIHDTIAKMHAAKIGETEGLSDKAPTAENVVTEAMVGKEANPTRAGPKPREGYAEAKQQAEVYKRWLGELDTKRRSDAEKSPQVAHLRAEEKAIVAKVRGGEKYLTKAARDRLAKIRAAIEDRVNPKTDNEDMAVVRAKMVEAHARMAKAAEVTKEKTEEPAAKKPASGEPVRIGKPTPREAETGNPTDADRFVANQMAQDTGGKPQFSPKVEEKGPVFFSALERAVDSVKFDKAPPGQWMATIKNMPGIKAEEIKTTGIDKWLGAQTRPVTKAEVLEQLEIGSVQIEEVMKGELPDENKVAEDIQKLERAYTTRTGLSAFEPGSTTRVTRAFEESREGRQWNAVLDESQKPTSPTKFAEYSLPGGKDYHELLLTLPAIPRDTTGWTAKEAEGDPASGPIWEVRDANKRWILGVPRESARTAQQAISRAAKNSPIGSAAGNFTSKHWAEKNVLAHIRFDTRTGPNGEKILHIAEIQSDWHQIGRKNGYGDPSKVPALIEAGKKATDEMYALREKKFAEATGGKYTSKREIYDAASPEAMEALSRVNAIDSDPEMLAAIKKHNDAVEALRKARSAVPDAPFKTTWHELAFKRALRYAVENGYDRVTWDTGDTNADRYDLSQKVQEIAWSKLQNGKVFLEVFDHDNEKVIDKSYEMSGLPDVVGKDIADQIAAKIQDGKTGGSIKGDNLKVGGSGMRGFYDKILPAFVDKYVKKWGAKVEDGTIGNSSDRYGIATVGTGYRVMDYDSANNDYVSPEFRTRAGAQAWIDNNSVNSAPVHSLDITPQMRADIMRGQPKFSPKVKPTAKELQKEKPELKSVVRNLTPEEIKDVSRRTVDQLVKLFNDMPSGEEYAAVAYSGRAKRGWYQHSAKAIVDVFGQQDGNRFTALLAALSPQTSVESNLENALRMWVNWNKAGRPVDPKAIGKVLGQSVQGNKGEGSVLDAWRNNTIRALTDADPARPDFLLSGPKVNSFAQNLRNEVNEVTNDAWMATFAALEPEEFASRRLANARDDIGKSFGFKSTGYIAASAKVREAAKILTRKTGQTWTPAEVQETVWSWAKTLYERRDRAGEYRTAQQILQDADMTHEDVNTTPDFAVLLTRGIYRNILEGGDYGQKLDDVERARAGDTGAGRPSGPSVSVTGAEGSGFTQTAFERHLQRAAKRLERVRTDRLAASGVNPRELIADARDSEIAANMSAATNTIPGIGQLAAAANAGDESAARLVNLIAHESLERLVATVPDAKLEVSRNGGLYGGSLEPSLGVKITFPEKRRAGVLAALAKFASNFNQEQIHVRQPTIDPVGRVYTDGSYATPVYSFELEEPLSREAIEQVIAESGLYGLNFSDKKLEAYYVGDPRDEAARAEFGAAIERARVSLGERARSAGRSVARLWAYGIGDGATAGYDAIAGDVPRGSSEYTEVPRAIAERDLGHEVDASDQASEITDAQRILQSKIADHYEQLPDNDMENPEVRRAYEELAKEIKKQFAALPIKVDVWNGDGEPYKSSADMRRDVLDNNHMWIYGTNTDTFGPPGASFRNHPLLELTGRESNNGYPLVVNDELRAVHDYYAHMLSPTTFGPRGEEAAWKNHLATIDNPWARWALTSETRGQNSWVNFGAHVDPSSKLSERPFARQKAALLPVEHMLTGNDAIDIPTHEFIRTLPDFVKNGSLPRNINDPFADFSPRVPSALREKLIRNDPSYKAMFDNNLPNKQLALPTLPEAVAKTDIKPGDEKIAPKPVVDLPPIPDREPRRRALQPIDGTGAERFRAINGALYNVGEEKPQMDRAARLVAEDPDRALAIAMLEQRAPAGIHPEFVFMALEEAAVANNDYALQERLSHSRISEEATTMGQRIAAWRNRAEIAPVDDMRKIREARETRAKTRGIDPTTNINDTVERGLRVSRATAKSTKKANWNDFIASLICKV